MLPVWLTDTVTSNLDRAIHYTLLWGLEGVELRTVGTPSNRVPFVNEEKLRRRMAEHALPIVAVVPGLFEGHEADRTTWMNEVAGLDDILQFCRRVACPRIITSAFSGEMTASDTEAAVEALRTAGKSAASYGVTIAVLNESGMARATAADVLQLVEAVDHPAVRLAWSPAEALRHGEAASSVVDRVAPFLSYVRCTDVRLEDSGFKSAPIGQGDVGWAELISELSDRGFDGPLSLEVHLEPKAKFGLFDATQIIQLLRQVGRGKAEAV